MYPLPLYLLLQRNARCLCPVIQTMSIMHMPRVHRECE